MSVSSELIEKTLELLENESIKRQQDFKLQVFKTLIGILQVVSGDNSLGHQSLLDLKQFKKIQDVLMDTIRSASKPFFYKDSVAFDYF